MIYTNTNRALLSNIKFLNEYDKGMYQKDFTTIRIHDFFIRVINCVISLLGSEISEIFEIKLTKDRL